MNAGFICIPGICMRQSLGDDSDPIQPGRQIVCSNSDVRESGFDSALNYFIFTSYYGALVK